MERTYLLLEKERQEKFSLLRSQEKLERDLSTYLHALSEKDTRISSLSSRLKQLEVTATEAVARAKKEKEESRHHFHLLSRKYKALLAKCEGKVLKEVASAPSTAERVRSIAVSLSPPREAVYGAIMGPGGLTPKGTSSAKALFTPTRMKLAMRPKSAMKQGEGGMNLKGVGRG